MFAILLKDLRSFANIRKYLIIQFIILTVLVFVLFAGTVEFYAQGIDINANVQKSAVGEQTYMLLVLCIFFSQFLVSRHAVDALNMEISGISFKDRKLSDRSNLAILKLTPLTNWRFLAGKLVAVVVWSAWGIWFTVPLFVISSFFGGLSISQLAQSCIVVIVSCFTYAMLGAMFALWLNPINAKTISYAIVLILTFLPIIPNTPFTEIKWLSILSPFSALLSVFQSTPNDLWLWNICFYCVFILLFFPVLIWRLSGE